MLQKWSNNIQIAFSQITAAPLSAAPHPTPPHTNTHPKIRPPALHYTLKLKDGTISEVKPADTWPNCAETFQYTHDTHTFAPFFVYFSENWSKATKYISPSVVFKVMK